MAHSIGAPALAGASLAHFAVLVSLGTCKRASGHSATMPLAAVSTGISFGLRGRRGNPAAWPGGTHVPRLRQGRALPTRPVAHCRSIFAALVQACPARAARSPRDGQAQRRPNGVCPADGHSVLSLEPQATIMARPISIGEHRAAPAATCRKNGDHAPFVGSADTWPGQHSLREPAPRTSRKRLIRPTSVWQPLAPRLACGYGSAANRHPAGAECAADLFAKRRLGVRRAARGQRAIRRGRDA
jgi:hypothetical protein